jgi:AraC-like DNA-binding protein
MGYRHTEPLLDDPLVRVGEVACRAPRSARCGAPEYSRDTQFVLPRSGVFAVHRRGEMVAADAATVVVLAAGEEYQVTHPADGGDTCTALAFAPEITQEALSGHRAPHSTLRAATQLAAWRLTAGLRRGACSLAAVEAAMVLLDAVTADLAARAAAPQPGPRARQRAEEVRALLACDPGAAWRLDQVARAVHCSPFHLARQFRAATGQTIGRYLLRLRLGLALERIAAGETSLARLAQDLGFAHHSHLTARFHAMFATTPSQLRTIVTAHQRSPS